MIKIIVDGIEHQITPTIFPDGTSQIWKTGIKFSEVKEATIIWNFEAEREVFDVLNLRFLFNGTRAKLFLHMPYMPFARQDKAINDSSTFALKTFANLINYQNFNKVTTVDVHNEATTKEWFNNFKNISVQPIIDTLQNRLNPDYLVFPDKGARSRYSIGKRSFIYGEKVRDQSTGKILSLDLFRVDKDNPLLDNKLCLEDLRDNTYLLIVDDLCDAGGTFVSLAKQLKSINPKICISLYVTHGIFSHNYGKNHLYDNGIDIIYTTNSLTNNQDSEFKV